MAPLLAVLLVFAAASAWAGETQTPPTDPPQARMQPPGGLTAQARMQPPGGIAPPPPPDTTTQARVAPPGGVKAPVPLFDMLRIWLQSRISIPPG